MRCVARGLFIVTVFTACSIQGAEPIAIQLTGARTSLNGRSSVPEGLFGVHATRASAEQFAEWGVGSIRRLHWQPDGTPTAPGHKDLPASVSMVVDCFYDRYQPALVLTRNDWREHLQKIGRRFAEEAPNRPHTAVLEFWNEPYLNWANRPGVNYDGRFYEGEGRTNGAPMTIRGRAEPLDSLVWSKNTVSVKPNGQVDYLATRYAPRDKKSGQTHTFRGKTYTLEERWWGRDPNQEHWWSGPQNLQFYLWMLQEIGPAMQGVNPDIPLAVGWDFNFFQSGWHPWKTLYRPVVDAGHTWIDGLTEHHYGGDTRMIAAEYEVAYAYAFTRYGKRLNFYNTEAGGMMDPEQPGRVLPDKQGNPRQKAEGTMMYTLRDLVYLLHACPDKAVARAAHEAHHDQGVPAAFKLLKPLRGTFTEITCDRPSIWPVAIENDGHLALAVFNDARETVSVQLDLGPFRPTAPLVLSRPTPGEDGSIPIQTDPLNPSDPVSIPGKSVVVIQGSAALDPMQRIHKDWVQWPAQEQLTTLNPGETVTFTFSVGEAGREAVQEAALALYQSQLAGKSLTARLNGRPLNLDPQQDWYYRIPLDPDLIQPTNTLELSLSTDETAPAYLTSASLYTARVAIP